MARKPTDYYQFKLRIRERLRRDLEREAKLKATSANHEAVTRIEASFAREAQRDSEKLQIEKDAEVLNLLVGRNEAAADLLRKIVFELQLRPRWDESRKGRKEIADLIHGYILPDFTGEK